MTEAAETDVAMPLREGTVPNLCKHLCVVDLSRLVAGNIASKILADLGARIIKIEKPDGGDSLRHWTCAGKETWWKIYGRGKESLALDLRSPEGKDVLRRFLSSAHVLIENFRPGTLEAMGFDPASLWENNPSLVILRISGWGQTGPFRHKPGFGTLIEAYSGFAAMNGYNDRPPLLPPFAMADAFAGAFGAVGILAAILRARETREGEVIDLSLLEPLLSILGPIALEAQVTGHATSRQGSRSPTHAPRNVYRTCDERWLALSAGTESMVRRLWEAIGKPDLVDDARFNTHAARLRNADEVDAEIAEFVASKNLDELLELFDKADVTAGAVMDALDLLRSTYVKDRGVLVAQPDHELGNIPAPHPPIRCLNARTVGLRSSPRLGEHTEEILTALGFDVAQQKAMRAAGIVRFSGER
jgi:formyl-CoA transferase